MSFLKNLFRSSKNAGNTAPKVQPEKVEQIDEEEAMGLVQTEAELLAAYGEYWTLCKAGISDIDNMRPAQRRKAIDKAAKMAYKLKQEMGTHDFIMSQAALTQGNPPTAAEVGYKAYNDAFSGEPKADSVAKFRENVEKAKEAMKAAKGSTFKAAEKAMKASEKSQKDEKEKNDYKESIERKYGYKVKDGTLKEMKDDKRENAKGWRQKQLLKDEEELVKALDTNGIFEHAYKHITTGTKNPEVYAVKRKSLAATRDVIYTLNLHFNRLQKPDYKAASLAKNLPEKVESADDVKKILESIEDVKTATQTAMKKRAEDQNNALNQKIEEIKKKKKHVKTDSEKEQEEKDLHALLDQEEEKYKEEFEEQAYKNQGIEKNVMVPYLLIGKGTLTSDARKELMDQQVALLRKHVQRSVVSAEYEDEFEKQLKQVKDFEKIIDQKERQTAISSLVKASTAVGVAGAKGKTKDAKDKRLLYHQQQSVDALKTHYEQKYPGYFKEIYDKIPADQKKTPKDQKKQILLAKKEAKDKKHADLIDKENKGGAGKYDSAYTLAYLSSGRLTMAGRKSSARKASKKAVREKDDNYQAMIGAAERNSVFSRGARRRAKKHMNRMKDKEYESAYNSAYESHRDRLDKQLKLPNQTIKNEEVKKQAAWAARKEARHRMRLASKTLKDERSESKYGDNYQKALGAYTEKYTDSSSKVRRHASAKAKRMMKEKDHKDTLAMDTNNAYLKKDAGSAAYQKAYTEAIKGGEKPSKAQEIARKQRESALKEEAKNQIYEQKVQEEKDSLPGLDQWWTFYKGKYGADKSAYKRAREGAKAARESREAGEAENISLYDHPQYQKAYMEKFEQTLDAAQAEAHALAVVGDLTKQKQGLLRRGKAVLEDEDGVEPDVMSRFQTWSASPLAKAVAHVKHIDVNASDEPGGFVDRILTSAKSKFKAEMDTKGKVDKPAQKPEDDGGFSKMDGVEMAVSTGLDAKSVYSDVKSAVEEGKSAFAKDAKDTVEDVAEQTSSFMDKLGDYTFLWDPLYKGMKLAKQIYTYVKDEKKEENTAHTKMELFNSIIDFIPTATTTITGIGKLAAEEFFKKAAPIVGGIETLISSGVEMLSNIVKIAYARKGAKTIKQQRQASQSAIFSTKNRSALKLKGEDKEGEAKVKVVKAGVRNILAEAEAPGSTTHTAEEIGELKRWQRDKEYQELFKKVIRDRGLDLAQNAVSVAQGLAQFVPVYGDFAAGVVGAFNTSASAVRSGVKNGKQVVREIYGAHPLLKGAGNVDLDKTQKSKFRDRSMFAEMIYGELLALPVPSAFNGVDPKDQKTWLDKTLGDYKRMEVYTSMAMDLGEIYKANSKDDVIEALISSMAAGNH